MYGEMDFILDKLKVVMCNMWTYRCKSSKEVEVEGTGLRIMCLIEFKPPQWV